MKKHLLTSLILIIGLFLAACGGTEGNDKSADEASDAGTEEKVYKVGIDVTYPPFEYEEDGVRKGIDIDLINAIAEDQGFKIEFSPMDFGGIIPAMQANQLDVAIAGMSITEERKKIVDFSEPYFDAGITIVVKKGDTSIKTPEDLKGKKVAVKKGTSGASYAMENAGKFGFEAVQFNDSPSMFQEVANGNADALIEDYPVISYAIAQSNLDLETVGERLNDDKYGIAVLKGENDDLLEKINKGLSNLKDSGKYDEILNTYLSE